MDKLTWTKTQKNLCILPVQEETSQDYSVSWKPLMDWHMFQNLSYQERIDTTLEHKHPAWLDDIINVPKRNIEKHETEVRESMEK